MGLEAAFQGVEISMTPGLMLQSRAPPAVSEPVHPPPFHVIVHSYDRRPFGFSTCSRASSCQRMPPLTKLSHHSPSFAFPGTHLTILTSPGQKPSVNFTPLCRSNSLCSLFSFLNPASSATTSTKIGPFPGLPAWSGCGSCRCSSVGGPTVPCEPLDDGVGEEGRAIFSFKALLGKCIPGSEAGRPHSSSPKKEKSFS